MLCKTNNTPSYVTQSQKQKQIKKKNKRLGSPRNKFSYIERKQKAQTPLPIPGNDTI